MNEVLDEIYAHGAEGQDGEALAVGVARDTAELLAALAADARSTLEVGMAHGLSTLAIAEAHRVRGTGTHVAIDPNQRTQFRGLGLANVERAGLAPYAMLIEEDSAEALPRLVHDGLRVQLAFVDGLHLFDAALVDFFYVDRLLEPGGAVVLDDLWMPSVRRLVAFVRRNRAYALERRPPAPAPPRGRALRRIARRWARDPRPFDRSGVRFCGRNACVLRKSADDRRPWDHHRSF